MLLIDQIQHQKQKGQITLTIFLDTKSFFSNRSLRLSFDNKTQEFSEIIAGIPQGSPVSPIFFLIYTRDLFLGLQSFNLSYIDDLSLSTSSTSLKKNVKILEQQVRLLSHQGKNLAIMFDIAKTELIHFTAKKERKERSLQLPDNTIVEPKDTIKWLGIYIDNRLSFKEHIATRSKEEEAIAHADYILSRSGDNFTAIYSDASQHDKGIGISVGVVACSQLVYNGELEGIAQAFEHAAIVAQEGQEIYVYADNQAAIHRLNNLSDNPGQQWLLRCIRAAKRITTKKASIHLQWALGHNDVKGNEKADTLAKEAAKERLTTSTTASLAYLGTEINKIQKTEQLMEYKRYTDRPTKNRSSYLRIFKLNTHTTIKVPKGTPREISSAFYSLKLGHRYFNSYLKRFNKRDCNLCICYKPQTPQHLLLECKQYKTHRNTLKEAIPHRPITLPLLLQTKTGIKATLAFIASTRIGTRKWHLRQTTEQTDTV
ncbi:hypothetical protein PtrM4_116560 [Pyrenophora tritici-repentis]|uniref:Reverse transcriptase domain-containing protein n=1 Tax=Pyrenophora tritici-repentis TaxID=45151 RepID=A0A834VLT4_9PLEO|nr:hypothetical protein PtrM4_116560 [Pyrenophora tritici-repentis]